MSLRLGTGLGLSRSGAGGGIALGRVLNLDWGTGQDYSALSITSSSAVGLVKGHDGVWVAKPAGYLAGLEGARINGSAPAWDDGSGNALSGVRWTGPKAATTTINAYSKPTPGTNGWTLSGATDGGSVPGPDGNATSAQRIVFSALSQQLYRTISGSTSTSIYCAVLIKGTAGNKINLSYGGFSDSVSWQFTLTGGWDKFSLLGAVSGTPNGANLSLNTTSFAPQGGLNPTASQTIDVFMLQLSTQPDAYIPTTGTNLTRFAETVTFPFTWLRDWTLFAELGDENKPDYSGGGVFRASITNTPLFFQSSTMLASYDGATVSFGSGSASTSSPFKVLLKRSGSALRLYNGTSFIDGDASFAPTETSLIGIGGYSGTDFTTPRNINKVKIWTRALSDAEMQSV